MTSRPFRFGVTLTGTTSRDEWQAKAKRAEDLGFDIVLVPDHLHLPAPFPALTSAADATNLRVGTYVLNAGFYRPALLARDVADLHRLTDGRFELGLGTGYNEAEFTAAGLPFLAPGKRIDHLADTVARLREQLDPMPPLMLAGSGDRMLRLAAREADIVGLIVNELVGGETADQALARRVDVLRDAAGDRFADLELNLFFFQVSVGTGTPDLSMARFLRPGLTDEQILALPGVLVGSARQVADELLRLRAEFGLGYVGILEPSMAGFAQVIELLR
ncbi:MAG TPA: TIGR03621 family F420-dependent LLM class oxidoreductase [Pseudonocardiaceae bacterium]|jgi:probable F420-dependent oxidoreductase|nr:TIGR03621 family F420-dependent LLM class oxidoreductase [Pseudonocardiaceae bacterium]